LKTKDRFEEKILREIRELSPHSRAKLSEIIRYIRLGIAQEETHQTKDVKRFAGMWQDMNQEEFDALLSTYNDRDSYFQRKAALTKRLFKDDIFT
jgi:hypothetical protein